MCFQLYIFNDGWQVKHRRFTQLISARDRDLISCPLILNRLFAGCGATIYLLPASLIVSIDCLIKITPF